MASLYSVPTALHWDRIAEAAGFSPSGLRLRVQELVVAMVGVRVEAIRMVSDQRGAEPKMV